MPGPNALKREAVSDWHDEVYRDRVRFGLRIRRSLYSGRSPYQTIDVFETEAFGRVLVLDGVYQTSEADEFYYHEMMAHPALATAPEVRRVLVIGGGDGGTVREVLRYPEVDRAVLVEIDGQVVDVCKQHLPAIGKDAWDDPRLEVVVGDGAAYVRDADVEPFDVMLVDISDPIGPAEGIFEASFLRGCERLLRPRGVFVMQSETPFYMPEVFARIVQGLRETFGRADPYVGWVPLYASGPWTWTYASRSVDPLKIADDRAERIEPHTRCWNREIHRAAFVLPNALKRLLD